VVWDDWAFISTGSTGIQVADVSSPTSPYVVRTVSGLATTDELWLFGSYLLVDTGGSGLRVLDIQSPPNAFLVESLNPGGSGTGFDVDLDARLAYSASGGTD
jgi:hypothetical protein